MLLQQNSGVTFVWGKPVRHANHSVLNLSLLAHRKAPFFLTKSKAFFYRFTTLITYVRGNVSRNICFLQTNTSAQILDIRVMGYFGPSPNAVLTIYR